MDTMADWRFTPPMSAQDQVLTPVSQMSPVGSTGKPDWPYAVGSFDFTLFDNNNRETSCMPSGASIGVTSAWGPQGQYYRVEEDNSVLSPLERLQRKWGIGDRKTRDGQPPKRRGPKPDSKPALTRRQELNRQAQRTHRERKENYMRDLEISVDRLRKLYAEDVDKVREENQKLKSILAAHGIQYDLSTTTNAYASTGSNFGGSATSLSGGRAASSSTGYTSPPSQGVVPPMPGMQHAHSTGGSPSFPQQVQSPSANALQPSGSNMHGLDYEEIGLDFVGTLEQNCMDHSQFLVDRSLKDENEVNGHALMATAIPHEHVHKHGMEVQYGHKLPDLPKPDLVKMLNLCTSLPGLADEVTPIMAYARILQHPRCEEMTKDDFGRIKEDLKPKVRCYGFGAVLEDFEIMDAVMSVLAAKGAPQRNDTAMEWVSATIIR